MLSTILQEMVRTSDHLDKEYIDQISKKTREIKSILVILQGSNGSDSNDNDYETTSGINDIFDELVEYMQQQMQRKIALLHKYCDGICAIGSEESLDDEDDCIIISPPEVAMSSIPSSEIIAETVSDEGIQSMENDDNSLESQYECPSPNTNIVLPHCGIITETQEQSVPSMPTLENDPETATNQEVQLMENDIDSEDSEYQISSDGDSEASEHDSDVPSSNVVDYKMLYKPGQTLKCVECDQLFEKHSEFINHMDAEHDIKRPYRCSHCTKCYGTRGNLSGHIYNVHAPRYECGVCHKQFGTKTTLKNHTVVHFEERPFSCSQCDSSFKVKGRFTQHIRSVHRKEKRFHCDHCSMGFFLKSTLIKHLRVHTGERPFQCTICGKAFTAKNTLTNHKRIHTGEKPYECSKCHKAFTRSDNMRRHEKICSH